MTTLLEASQALLKAAKLSVKWRATGIGRPTEQLMMLEIEALEQAIAQEQPKLKHKMPARGCYTCKHEDERIGVPPCLTCSGKNWEPKP